MNSVEFTQILQNLVSFFTEQCTLSLYVATGLRHSSTPAIYSQPQRLSLTFQLEMRKWLANFSWTMEFFAVHSIDNELEDNTKIKAVVRSSLALCSSVYVMTSLFGFLLFGDATLDDVLANFDADLGIPYGSLLNDVVRVSYAAHLMLVFPIVFYPLRLNMDGLLFPYARPLASDNLRFALISCGLIGLIFLGANFIPSIWDAFQFTGATAAVCIGFIFPAAITLRYITFFCARIS